MMQGMSFEQVLILQRIMESGTLDIVVMGKHMFSIMYEDPEHKHPHQAIVQSDAPWTGLIV